MEESRITNIEYNADIPELTIDNYLQITEEVARKNYLSRLTDFPIAPVGDLEPLESDIIENIRLYKITEMVYQKGESITDKFTTVFNTLSTYNASVFIVMDSDGRKTNFYLGVRNNETNDDLKRSTVTLGDTLKDTLIGHFPGSIIENEDRQGIERICKHIENQKNMASVSVSADCKTEKQQENEQFVQGLEKLALAMQGREYTGIIIAESQPHYIVERIRKNYQDQYTMLSPLQKIQFNENESYTTSRSKSFSEMTGKQKGVIIANAAISVGIATAGAIFGNVAGVVIGGQIAGQLGGFINSLAPPEQISNAVSKGKTTTTENKAVTDMMNLLDESLKRTRAFDSYGMWSVAGYFVSDDMSSAEIAASNYRSLMNGENTGREVSAINSWRMNEIGSTDYGYLSTYLSRFNHPKFFYGADYTGALLDASTWASGKELGIQIGLPRATVPGLPVIKHAEFGKEVITYQMVKKKKSDNPKDRIDLGRIFDLGQITDKTVELDNRSLNMHTFITGPTGPGKSNTVYQILNELRHDGIPFLVVEPAKGEYKDVFGNLPDVNVFSTNPNIARLININPFMFPKSIHVLEHVDGLVEIFSVCWPMYDAMPAFFKDAILKAYESVGWDLGSSTFEGDSLAYPDFDILAEQLDKLIEESDYASDIKSNYRGALITRVKSLTVGLNKFIFTREQTPYSILFDNNCILDLSRVKSAETKALLMGLMVYILNEYRTDQKAENNSGLRHVTVLEEAHNLLKNTSKGESELIGKSVEMLTQTIAEIRTYGEGFVIVDQSPSSVDIAAIKNTNTKIVLRTPEANDREAVGRSIGLNESQVNEIAKLPSGVAVVYQNDWVSPVLALINKAQVTEKPYTYLNKEVIKPVKQARTELISALMQPWLNKERLHKKGLLECLKVLDMKAETRGMIEGYIDDYTFLGGSLFWEVKEIPKLQKCLMAILGITAAEFKQVLDLQSAGMLMNIVRNRTTELEEQDINEICNVLTKVGE